MPRRLMDEPAAEVGRVGELAAPMPMAVLAICETKFGLEHPHTVKFRANLTALLSRPG